MYAGKKFEIVIEGSEYFKELEEKDEGFIQLSSHIGNYEIAGYSLKSNRKTIRPIVYSFEKESDANGSKDIREYVQLFAMVLYGYTKHQVPPIIY